MGKWIAFVVFLSCGVSGFGQGVEFGSSDTALGRAFYWAKGEALHYRGKPGDAVGPWYESALPPRYAFCMRDVSHQCIGGAILGLDAENKNMLTLFARNISEAKDWCSWWEINRMGVPAPADYRNDKEFWYNLDANFDILSASWRLAAWTGDSSYIEDAVFKNFQERSVGVYIDKWVLQADSLLTRPAHPNAPQPYVDSDDFHRCRGLPSYSEGIADMKVGVDLVAALYRGLMTYAEILRKRGQISEAIRYQQRAEGYLAHLEANWWDSAAGLYHTWYSNTGQFGKREGEIFLLWFDALKDTTRARRTIEHLAAGEWNVETRSYFPYVFYREGYWDEARKVVLYLSDPGTVRREYPEVAFGVVQGIVLGLMGVDVVPGTRTVTSLYRSSRTGAAWVKSLPILGTTIEVRHTGNKKSSLSNTGSRDIVWRAEFAGLHRQATVGGRVQRLKQEQTRRGQVISYVDVPVMAGVERSVTVAGNR